MENQAFNYHGNQTAGASCPHFTQRLNVFRQGLAELMTFVSQATTNALTANHHDDTPICIYDLCTGPKFSAVAKTVTNLQK